jgi:predicted dehydrogenase/aryl-alcohol dehydrogenase-like predicted oxidoreductase
MKQIRWGIIGPGRIAHNFADGLKEAPSGVLMAVASTDDNRRQTFGKEYGIGQAQRHASYQALFADPEIDAVYIATPHTLHAQLSIEAMRSGKSVLCEKPAGLNAAEVVAVVEVAEQQGVFFMEAYMYRFHPQIARLLEILAFGEIGTPLHIRAAFGFDAAFDPASRLFDRGLAGGGILDVGGYPVSLARLVAGATTGKPFDEPETIKGIGIIGKSNVDEVAYALLKFANGFTAELACAISRNMDNSAKITGTQGTIEIDDPWVPGRNGGPSNAILRVTSGEGQRVEQVQSEKHLFAFEAEAASIAIATGSREHDAMSHADSIGNNAALGHWRSEIGYRTVAEDPAAKRILPGVLPRGLPRIPRIEIEGVDLPVSCLVVGCDNKSNVGDGSIIWDAWMEAGGNAFDTAFVYGAGLHETVLGQWIASRGVASEVVVIVKGAHTPYCTPRSIETQLDISLDRLGLDRAPVYIMHRDNPDVPVDELVDALDRLSAAGKIGAFGGSNWSVERFDSANRYARESGRKPMTFLNNNLSLAVMERPVWKGCVSSNNLKTLAYLRNHRVNHLSWSSQARGYFLPSSLRNRLPAGTSPDVCFGSEANEERRSRAVQIARKYNVSPHNVATAWALTQSFPSLALIGPRSPGEIASTLPALSITLEPNEVAWLNLEADEGARP